MITSTPLDHIRLQQTSTESLSSLNTDSGSRSMEQVSLYSAITADIEKEKNVKDEENRNRQSLDGLVQSKQTFFVILNLHTFVCFKCFFIHYVIVKWFWTEILICFYIKVINVWLSQGNTCIHQFVIEKCFMERITKYFEKLSYFYCIIQG